MPYTVKITNRGIPKIVITNFFMGGLYQSVNWDFEKILKSHFMLSLQRRIEHALFYTALVFWRAKNVWKLFKFFLKG